MTMVTKWLVLMALPLTLAGCVQTSTGGGQVRISHERMGAPAGKALYATSCDARDLSGCERAAAQVCPEGSRVKENRVKPAPVNSRRAPTRSIVFACR
ncbi:hypothetical protein [Paracoccus xiamenensis]|uniref:hypothetical protein n=1 Tax=Paracoccus xiamenensis TaxID=2714901 RepID=UPI00140DE6D7|nr:hypothetical protein [Paracoccus xiamenensis]NHF73881.1 hypothetical protein [Paracoccus xiamenensis]